MSRVDQKLVPSQGPAKRLLAGRQCAPEQRLRGRELPAGLQHQPVAAHGRERLRVGPAERDLPALERAAEQRLRLAAAAEVAQQRPEVAQDVARLRAPERNVLVRFDD